MKIPEFHEIIYIGQKVITLTFIIVVIKSV